MVFKLFSKPSAKDASGDASKSRVGAAETWPFPDHTEAHLKGLMAARVRYLQGNTPLDPGFPDLSGLLVELGQTVNQRVALRKMWKDEVDKAQKVGNGSAKPQDRAWFE